jgi:catechol 2,3-dioxygenase-like lactoylglutathione lyase family enzyme
MTVQIDHILVPSRDMNASAKLLAEILGVPWEPSGRGPVVSLAFTPWVSGQGSDEVWREYRAQRASVYVNDSLTLDFIKWGAGASAGMGKPDEPVPVNHYCFRVSNADFDAILARIKKAGIKFSSSGVGEPDDKINTRLGGKGVYFMEPDGHGWEILTVSYARSRK